MGTVFVAGVYGVGKSTVVKKLSQREKMPCYSASELIGKNTGESYSFNKAPNDITTNQILLISEVSSILKRHKEIILAGHFCILNSRGEIEKIPSFVYENLLLEKIILLEAPTDIVVSNLYVRSNIKYDHSKITALQEKEKEYASIIAKLVKCELFIHRMLYSDDDLALLEKIIYCR